MLRIRNRVVVWRHAELRRPLMCDRLYVLPFASLDTGGYWVYMTRGGRLWGTLVNR